MLLPDTPKRRGVLNLNLARLSQQSQDGLTALVGFHSISSVKAKLRRRPGKAMGTIYKLFEIIVIYFGFAVNTPNLTSRRTADNA